MYYFYVIRSESGEYYSGYSSDLRRRFAEHNSGAQTATRGRQWSLVYYEAYVSERAARERERTIKRNGRMRGLLMRRIRAQQSD